jgi:hypothetical protein
MRASSRRLSLVILGIFILTSLVTMLRHEMWRDEFESWLIAKESSSLAALGEAVRYEKHPLSWYVVLFLLTRLTQSHLSLQLLHLGLASLSAWLVLRFAPFRFYQRILLVFGYYLFFEYSIISRAYALAVLSLFLFCVFLTRRPDKPLLWGACLFVLANTSLYGLILAAGAGAAAALDVARNKTLRRKVGSYAALFLAVLGGALCLLSLVPVPDSSYDQVSVKHVSFNPDLLSRVLHVLPRAFLALPRFTLQFWNSTVLDGMASHLLCNLVMALLILAFAVALLRKHTGALILFMLSTLGILGWSYYGSVGFIRHQGHVFIAFIAALWLAGGRRGADANPSEGEGIPPWVKPGGLSWVLTSVLAIQCVAGLYAAGMDVLYPFSRGKETARFIRDHGYGNSPIVGEMDYLMTPVCAYLGRKVYLVRGERLGSYARWDMKRFMDVPPELILTRAEQFAWRKQRDCLILLNFTLDPRWEQPGRLIKLLSTGPAVVGSETYRLYLWRYTGPSPVRE